MRVTCPSCASRYEVADGLIAAGGRHVQCSACHARWFERPAAGRPVRLGEDEIIARLEFRGTRPRLVAQSEQGAAATSAEAPAQGGRDFVWEARGTEGGDESEAERGGGHLRLVAAGNAGAGEGEADPAEKAEEVPPAPAQHVERETGKEAAPVPRRRVGTALFLSLLVLVAVLIGLYAASGPLAAAMPAAAPLLDAIVALVETAGALVGRIADAVAGAVQ